MFATSGAQTAASPFGCGVNLAEGDAPPVDIPPPPSPRKQLLRRGITEWLVERRGASPDSSPKST
jgi:hypothetical protein